MKNTYIILLLLFLCTKNVSAQYIGEIKMISGNKIPRGWYLCDGRLLSIAQNIALFNILSTRYGGDGMTTFALPDLRGRTPVGKGNTTNYGQKSGTETITITNDNIPAHNHTIDPSYLLTSNNGTANIPSFGVKIASPLITVQNISRPIFGFNDQMPDTPLAPVSTTSGGGIAIPIEPSVMQPYIAINYIICTWGNYPSPN